MALPEDKVRIAVQLIDTRRDIHVWAEIYERPWTDILALQKEIAADVCEHVRVRLSTPERHRLASSGRVNTKAYEASLVGEYLLANKITPDGLERAFTSFRAAIAADPMYAPAYVGLANCYWGSTQFGIFPPEQGMPRAKKDYPRAIAALTRSSVLAGEWGMEPLAFLGYLYGILGRADEARDVMRRLDEMEAKGASISPFLRAEPLLGKGEIDTALGLLEKAYDEHDLNLVWNFQDPILDRLRGEPRFAALKKKLGL